MMGVTHAHRCRSWSRGEEIANSLSHGIGLLAALIAVPLLLTEALRRGNPQSIVTAGVFGFTVLLLYLASTLFHALPDGRAKRVFEVFDNAAVFLLIAGTYTPLTLGPLRGVWGGPPRCRLDAGRGRYRSDCGGRLALPGHIRLSLSLHGMAVSCRCTPARAVHATARRAAGAGWRARIYGRPRILGSARAALPPSCLALVRPSRDGLPLPRDPLVCDLTRRTSRPMGRTAGSRAAGRCPSNGTTIRTRDEEATGTSTVCKLRLPSIIVIGSRSIIVTTLSRSAQTVCAWSR